AIVVLPPDPACLQALEKHARWLARGKSSSLEAGTEPLLAVLSELGVERPPAGLAALRIWGQTDEPPGQWTAAADPVYFEAMLDHIRVHAVRSDELQEDEVRELVGLLNEKLPGGGHEFLRFGKQVYLQCAEPFRTSGYSASSIDGLEPDRFLPAGADARDHDRLTGELQMLLHDAGINQVREQKSLMPVNSLWLWGGGTVAESGARHLPPLIGEDPLFRGFWKSCGDDSVQWPLRDPWSHVASRGFVSVVRPDDEIGQALDGLLLHARQQLVRGNVRQLTIFFGGRRVLRLRRPDLLAFWRKAPLKIHDGAGP
ncbi:MAG: hypothetical protein RLN69_15755, partial [Woeseiaceae bacterium]